MARITSQETPLQTRVWTPQLLLLLACGHLWFITFYSLIVSLPKYLSHHSDIVIGIVVGTFGFGSFLARLWAGALSDFFGRRIILLIGATGSAISLLAYAQGDFPPGMVPVRLAHGILWVAAMTAWTTLCIELGPPGKRSQVIGGTLTATHSASLYAPALALFLGSELGFRFLFVLLGMTCLLATALAALVPEPHFVRQPWKLPRRIPFSRPTLVPFLSFLGTTVPFGIVQGFLILRVEGHASPQFFFLAFGVCVIATSLIAGAIANRIGLSSLAKAGLVLVGLSMVLVAMTAESVPLVAAGLLFAAGFGAGYTGVTTLAGEAVPAEERGLAIATVTMAFDFGTAAPFVLGALSDVAGTPSVFWFGAVVAAVSLVVLMRFRSPPPRVFSAS